MVNGTLGIRGTAVRKQWAKEFRETEGVRLREDQRNLWGSCRLFNFGYRREYSVTYGERIHERPPGWRATPQMTLLLPAWGAVVPKQCSISISHITFPSFSSLFSLERCLQHLLLSLHSCEGCKSGEVLGAHRRCVESSTAKTAGRRWLRFCNIIRRLGSRNLFWHDLLRPITLPTFS